MCLPRYPRNVISFLPYEPSPLAQLQQPRAHCSRIHEFTAFNDFGQWLAISEWRGIGGAGCGVGVRGIHGPRKSAGRGSVKTQIKASAPAHLFHILQKKEKIKGSLRVPPLPRDHLHPFDINLSPNQLSSLSFVTNPILLEAQPSSVPSTLGTPSLTTSSTIHPPPSSHEIPA